MTLNLAPMVDVMMCLIIFFLLASELADADNQPVELPWAVAARQVERGDLGLRITINVRKSTQQPDQPEYVIVDWDGQSIQERRLRPEDLEPLLASRALRAAADRSKLTCVIRADRDLRYQHVETVMRAAALAKISALVFSANEGTDPGALP